MTELYDSGVVERELSERGSFASITKGVSMRPLFRTCRDMIVISPIEKPLKNMTSFFTEEREGNISSTELSERVRKSVLSEGIIPTLRNTFRAIE